MDKAIITLQSVNHRSDFDLLLRLYARDGNEIGFPECDWKAEFSTWSLANAFIASCYGGVCTNCYNDGGVIHVVFNGHKLGPGVLKVRFTLENPNGIYGDGTERIVTPATLSVELVREAAACQCPQTFSADVYLSVLREADVADAVLQIVNRQLTEILGRGPADFRPVAAAAAAAAAPSGIYTLYRGDITIGAKPGFLYRSRARIRLPMGSSVMERTFSIAGIDPELLDGQPPEGITLDLEAQTVTAVRRTDKSGCALTLNCGDGGYLMRGSDGIIRHYADESFAMTAERPALAPPTLDEIRYDITAPAEARKLEYQHKRARICRSEKSLVLDAGGSVVKKSKWRRRKHPGHFGVYRVRRRSHSRVSPWVTFSVACLHDGTVRISLL